VYVYSLVPRAACSRGHTRCRQDVRQRCDARASSASSGSLNSARLVYQSPLAVIRRRRRTNQYNTDYRLRDCAGIITSKHIFIYGGKVVCFHCEYNCTRSSSFLIRPIGLPAGVQNKSLKDSVDLSQKVNYCSITRKLISGIIYTNNTPTL